MCRIDLQIMPNARADRVRCYVVVASYSFYLTLALAAASLYHNNVWEKFKKKWRMQICISRKNTIRRSPTGKLHCWTKKKTKQKPSKQTNIHWLGNVGTSVCALSKQLETNSQAQGHCRRDPCRLEGNYQENPEEQPLQADAASNVGLGYG